MTKRARKTMPDNTRDNGHKPQAVEVALSDGRTVYVRKPGPKSLGLFIRSMPAMQAMSDAFKASQMAAQGVTGIPTEIPDSAIEGTYPLLSVMSGIPVEEFDQLAPWDYMALLNAMAEFMPKSPSAAQTTSPESTP